MLERGHHLLAIDQGTTSTRAFLFDAALRAGRIRAARISADLSRARLGRARSAGHLDHLGRDRARRDGERRRRGERRRGDRHHQPARDHDRLGPRDRQADPQRDRLAGPPHRTMPARRSRAPATRSWSASAPGCCSIRISRRRKSPGCSTMCAGARAAAEAGRARLRHGRHVSALAASPAARCTRPTPPMRRAPRCSISAPANGTTELLDLFGIPASLLPEVRDCAADFGTTLPHLLGGAGAHPRHRRRPAGRDRSGRAASSPA